MMFPCFLLLQIMMFSYYHWFSREWQATSVSLHRCQQPGPWPSTVSTETPPVTRRPSPAISDPRNARGWAFSTFASTDLGSRRRYAEMHRALRSSPWRILTVLHGAAIYGVPRIPSIYPLYVSINIAAPWILWVRISMIFEFEKNVSTRTLQVFPHRSVAKFLSALMA